MQPELGAIALRRRMARSSHKALRPSPRLTGSEWAERHLHMERIGRWRWESAPYMRGIQDSLCDPKVPRVVLQKGSQIGGTMGGLIAMLGYAVHQRPTRVLVYFPSESDAKKFSRDKLDSVFRESPELRGTFTVDSLFEKRFPGGMLFVQTGGTPRTFRQTDAEWVALDDLDGFELEIGEEGDPVRLAENRTKSYRRGKLVAISTPTVKDFSRIEDLLLDSDVRRFHVPCPHCEHRQVLRWGGPDKDYGFKWDTEEGPGGELRPVYDSIAYLCESCGTLIEERHKAWMVRAAASEFEDRGWIPDHPERSEFGHGYHLPQFVSLFPGASWPSILKQWVEAKGDAGKLKTVVNQVFAETWEERGEKAEAGELEARAEVYVGADGDAVVVPDGVGVICAGVDVQADRFEVLVRGYGVGWESWDILHERIWGDVQREETKARLRTVLFRRFRHASGTELGIFSAMIDSGYEAAMVYDFVRPLEARNVWASKGDAGSPGAKLLARSTRANESGVKLWTVGTFPAKRDLFRRLQIRRPGPRYIHFRTADPALCNGFDAEYFAEFAAEKMVRKRRVPSFVQIRRRNEAIDLHVLADSAFRGLGPSFVDEMERWVEAARGGASPLVTRTRGRRVRSRGVA